MNKKLYGKNKDGSFKVWEVSTTGCILSITFGKEGGKMQTKSEVIAGKNIGRANETTPVEQAELEAMSRWRKQIDKGYRETKEELEELPLLPMLAQDYLKQGHRIKYPCFGSPKLDGVRCLAIRHHNQVELKSRGGKEYSVPHIQDQLFPIMKVGDVWDGELYIHGKYLEEIVSAVKKYNDLTPNIEFIIFDMVKDESYEHRLISMQALRRYTLSCVEAPSIDVIEFCEIQDENHMKQKHKEYVARGYEGVMLRNHGGKYESGKRSADLQKYKEMIEDDFLITGVTEDRNGNAVFIVYDRTANSEFNVVGGDFESRQRAVKHPEEFIGKWANIAFQTRYKDSKLPQFPVIRTIREGSLHGEEFIAGE